MASNELQCFTQSLIENCNGSRCFIKRSNCLAFISGKPLCNSYTPLFHAGSDLINITSADIDICFVLCWGWVLLFLLPLARRQVCSTYRMHSTWVLDSVVAWHNRSMLPNACYCTLQWFWLKLYFNQNPGLTAALCIYQSWIISVYWDRPSGGGNRADNMHKDLSVCDLLVKDLFITHRGWTAAVNFTDLRGIWENSQIKSSCTDSITELMNNFISQALFTHIQTPRCLSQD